MYQKGLHVLLRTCPQYLNNNKNIDNAKLAWIAKKVNHYPKWYWGSPYMAKGKCETECLDAGNQQYGDPACWLE